MEIYFFQISKAKRFSDITGISLYSELLLYLWPGFVLVPWLILADNFKFTVF